MDANDTRKDNTHEYIKALQALPRLFLLKVQHRIPTRGKVSIENLGHKFSHLQKLIAIQPISKMPSKVCGSHDHQSLLMVEDPGLAKVYGRIEHLPEQDYSNQKVTQEDDSEDSVDPARLVGLRSSLVQAKVACDKDCQSELDHWSGKFERLVPLIGCVVGLLSWWSIHTSLLLHGFKSSPFFYCLF